MAHPLEKGAIEFYVNDKSKISGEALARVFVKEGQLVELAASNKHGIIKRVYDIMQGNKPRYTLTLTAVQNEHGLHCSMDAGFDAHTLNAHICHLLQESCYGAKLKRGAVRVR